MDLFKYILNFLMENVNILKYFNIYFDLLEFLNVVIVLVYIYIFVKGLLILYVYVYKKNC